LNVAMRNLLVVLAAAALSCGGTPTTQYLTEQTPAGACTNPPVTLTGTLGAGAGCSGASVCAPICCQCSLGTTDNSFTLAACQDGVCAQDEIVCEDAEDPSVCP
jgi:hypothetical protein